MKAQPQCILKCLDSLLKPVSPFFFLLLPLFFFLFSPSSKAIQLFFGGMGEMGGGGGMGDMGGGGDVDMGQSQGEGDWLKVIFDDGNVPDSWREQGLKFVKGGVEEGEKGDSLRGWEGLSLPQKKNGPCGALCAFHATLLASFYEEVFFFFLSYFFFC